MLAQIRQEITQPYYQQNFPNDGTRFVAWYVRRVLRRDAAATVHDISDGANDKQIDAVVVDDDERCVIFVQGKFLDGTKVDGEPLREVLTAWARLNDLGSLQNDCNSKLRQKLGVERCQRVPITHYNLRFIRTRAVRRGEGCSGFIPPLRDIQSSRRRQNKYKHEFAECC
jgi:hypothetical protein